MTTPAPDRRAPPYVAYRTWETFLQQLKQDAWPDLPQQLDSSVWAEWGFNGSNQSALKRALVFLGLTTDDYRPTEDMKELIGSQENEVDRKAVLERIVHDRYLLVLGGMDLGNATRQQVRTAFQRAGSGTKTADKAVSFFVAIAQDAGGVVLGTQLRKRNRRSPIRGSASRKTQTENADEPIPKIDTENRTLRNQIAQVFGTEKTLEPLVQALVDELPGQGEQWPVRKKQMFDNVWNATMVYLYEDGDPIDIDD